MFAAHRREHTEYTAQTKLQRPQEVLTVRWASDDPNPGVVAARKRGAEDALDAAVLSAWWGNFPLHCFRNIRFILN